jgi:predicted branched-subunit amino acid permease
VSFQGRDNDGRDDPPSNLRAGVRAGRAYAVAVLFLAISFGVLARPVMGNVAPIVMSAIVFAGSAQFASVAVLAAGGGAGAAIVAGLLLNARYGPMGIALGPSLGGGPFHRAAVGQAMIDASWAMASRAAAASTPRSWSARRSRLIRAGWAGPRSACSPAMQSAIPSAWG